MIQLLKIIKYCKLGSTISVLIVINFFIALSELIGLSLIFPIIKIVLGDFDKSFIEKISFVNTLNFKSENFLILILFLLLLKVFVVILLNYLNIKLLAKIRNVVSIKVFKNYIFLNYDQIIKKGSNEIIRNLTTTMNELNNRIIIPLTIIMSELILLSFILIFVLLIDINTALIGIILFFLIGILIFKFSKNKLKFYGVLTQNNENKKIKLCTEMLNGIKEIKLFQCENLLIKNYKEYDYNVAISHGMSFFLNNINKYIIEFVLILILFFGFLVNINDYKNLIPLLALYAFIALRYAPSLNRLVNSFQAFKYGNEILDIICNNVFSKIKISDEKKDTKVRIMNYISFKDVSFRYNKKTNVIFNNINLTLKKKNIYGIYGSSGSGKTTFVNLLTGLLKPTSGSILIDGVKFNQSKLIHSKVFGYISQDSFILDDTIFNNLSFRLKSKEENYKLALDALNKALFKIDNINNNNLLDYQVGENGKFLSGGQKQRLMIARAFFNKSQILIFDESTSQVDKITQNKILTNLQDINENYIIIFITHDLSLKKYFDKCFEFSNFSLSKIR